MSAYHEFTFWSPWLDCEAVRVSMANASGQEFYRIIPRENGKRWRERRTEALDIIETAIAQGCEPGEVRVEGEAA